MESYSTVTVRSRTATFFRLYCLRCLCAPLCSLIIARLPRGNTGAGLLGCFGVGVEVDKEIQVLGHVVRRAECHERGRSDWGMQIQTVPALGLCARL